MTTHVKAGQTLDCTVFSYSSLRMKADGNVESSIFDTVNCDIPEGAVLSLTDPRLKELLKTREPDATLGDAWETGTSPRDTAKTREAAQRGKCWASYELAGENCDQHLKVKWDGKGGGEVQLTTCLLEPGVPDEPGYPNLYLTHDMAASFDKSKRGHVKEESICSEVEELYTQDYNIY